MEQEPPERRRIVVDGSNIATEGRSLPSLAQLDEAIRTFLEEYRGFNTSDVTVVVDASFGHRIDPSEVKAFEQAIEHGEMITPPAGAVGRGDGFILRIAEKSGALVLSNDSFQEFHAERPWLFEPGRLIGGKPVPGVGWIFTPRTPVRGAKSRSVTGKSRREAKAADVDGSAPPDQASTPVKAAKATKSARRTTKATLSASSNDRNGTGAGDDHASANGAVETAKAAKATKATKAAKASKATKAEKAGGATKAAKASKVTKATKAAKAAKGDKEAGEATKATKATKAAKAGKAIKATKAGKAIKATKATKASKASRAGKTDTDASPADEVAGPEADPSAAPGRRSRRSRQSAAAATDDSSTGSGPVGPALNDPMTFLTFVADHPIGSEFDGTVVSFTSHGAHVEVGGMLCHVPLRGLGDPPPNKARQVLTKGEVRRFVLVSLDAARRRAELALPGVGG
jgi:hypothetical protein